MSTGFQATLVVVSGDEVGRGYTLRLALAPDTSLLALTETREHAMSDDAHDTHSA